MKRILFRVAATLMAAACTLVAVELLANMYLLARDRRYIPARVRLDAISNTFVDGLTRLNPGCRYIDTLYPHPYLGFVHHGNPPCGSPDINNIGLFGPDYPSERRDDRFVVLVTGGSVAAQLAGSGAHGVSYLQAILEREYVSPNGRPFLLLNGGDGGWRQPQQLILFLLYADAVHAVVTLDGFNERYFVGSSVRFEYPPHNFEEMNPLLRSSYGDVVARWIAGKLYGRARANPILSRSQAAYLVLARLDAYVKLQRQLYSERTNINTMFALPKEWDEEYRVAWATGQYRKYIRAMDAVAAQHGVLPAHFIQPVPAIGKPLTDEERIVVGDLGYRAKYERIAKDVLSLSAEGTPIFSLLDLFENNHNTLYADVIHLRQDADGTSEGYRLMAERMAAQLARSWSLQRRRSGGEGLAEAAQ
jgi:hypothetical protein